MQRQKINSSLSLVESEGKQVIQCKCGKVLCDAGENYKESALRCDGPLSDAGPERIFSGKYRGEERFVFRRFYCPSCLTVLETEVAPAEAPVIKDYLQPSSPVSEKK